jgi:hypothetical protein
VLLVLGTLGLARPTCAEAPDLIIDRARLAVGVQVETVPFAVTDCAAVEGCVNASGARKIVRFETGIANIGKADLVVGNPNDHPELFMHSDCHGHFHFRGVALYELVASDGSVAASSGKRAFCLRDNVKYSASAGESRGYNCDNQGITAGWADVYDKSLDCQFLDITGVPGGHYTLRVTVNPERLLAESNYDNNSASVALNLAGDNGTGNGNGNGKGKIKKPKKPKHPHWKRGHDKWWKEAKKPKKEKKSKKNKHGKG